MKQLITLILLSIIALSCKKDPVETDPAKAILGKWECTAVGNGAEMTPVTPAKGYIEYTTDSIVKSFDYETLKYSYARFWVDSLLYKSQYTDDGLEIIYAKYHLMFYDNNNQLKMQLSPPLSVINTFIYKRIN